MSLEQEIKKEIGYVDKVRTCATCKHSIERECTHTDRMWYLYCNIADIKSFRTAANSGCLKHELPEEQKG